MGKKYIKYKNILKEKVLVNKKIVKEVEVKEVKKEEVEVEVKEEVEDKKELGFLLPKNSNLINLDQLYIKADFLPFICFERDNKEFLNHLKIIEKEEKDFYIQKNDFFVHLCTREGVRESRGEEYIARYLKPLNENIEKLEEFKQMKERSEKGEGTLKMGFTHLVLVSFISKGVRKYRICTIEAYGEPFSFYFVKFLRAGELNERKKVTLLLTDHSENKKMSKKGFSYFQSHKFTQFKSENLNKEEIEGLKSCYSDNEEKIKNFLNK